MVKEHLMYSPTMNHRRHRRSFRHRHRNIRRRRRRRIYNIHFLLDPRTLQYPSHQMRHLPQKAFLRNQQSLIENYIAIQLILWFHHHHHRGLYFLRSYTLRHRHQQLLTHDYLVKYPQFSHRLHLHLHRPRWCRTLDHFHRHSIRRLHQMLYRQHKYLKLGLE